MTRRDWALAILLAAILVWKVGPAFDYEQASAGSPPVVKHTSAVEGTYQGLSARAWAKRAVQQRKNSNARGRTIRRLQGTLRRGFIPSYWLKIGSCESGLRWTYNGSSGFDGAVQFEPGTWRAYKLPWYPAFAWQATPFQQLVVAELVLAAQGWGAWPACSRKVGLR